MNPRRIQPPTQPRAWHGLLVLVLTLVLGVVDLATGYELQFFLFYFIPVTLAAWCCGRKLAVFIAVLSAVVWAAADRLSGHPYTYSALALWNTTIRLLAFLIVGLLMARVQSLLLRERKITADLQQALSEVNTLSGLLPICARCKKIRNDQGYWQQLEGYLSKHAGLRFSHGYCTECAARASKEIEADAAARGLWGAP